MKSVVVVQAHRGKVGAWAGRHRPEAVKWGDACDCCFRTALGTAQCMIMKLGLCLTSIKFCGDCLCKNEFTANCEYIGIYSFMNAVIGC